MHKNFFSLSLLAGLLLVSCSVENSTDLKIFPGELHEGTPEIFMMRTSKGNCTASFIKKHIALTAAHCVVKLDKSEKIKYGDVESKEIVMHPQYKYDANEKKTTLEGRPYDLAAIIFPNDVASAVLELANKPAKVGDQVVMFGYAGGQSKIGYNQIFSFVRELIVIAQRALVSTEENGLEIASLPEAGDSGGPLFINGKLAGVTQGGDMNMGIYVDLNSKSSQKFLKSLEGK